MTGRWAKGKTTVYVFVDGIVYVRKTGSSGKFKFKLKKRVAVGTGIYATIRTGHGKSIKAMRKWKVVLGKPSTPNIYGRLTTRTTKIIVLTREKCPRVVREEKTAAILRECTDTAIYLRLEGIRTGHI